MPVEFGLSGMKRSRAGYAKLRFNKKYGKSKTRTAKKSRFVKRVRRIAKGVALAQSETKSFDTLRNGVVVGTISAGTGTILTTATAASGNPIVVWEDLLQIGGRGTGDSDRIGDVVIGQKIVLRWTARNISNILGFDFNNPVMLRFCVVEVMDQQAMSTLFGVSPGTSMFELNDVPNDASINGSRFFLPLNTKLMKIRHDKCYQIAPAGLSTGTVTATGSNASGKDVTMVIPLGNRRLQYDVSSSGQTPENYRLIAFWMIGRIDGNVTAALNIEQQVNVCRHRRFYYKDP